jgi:hypothetical protein
MLRLDGQRLETNKIRAESKKPKADSDMREVRGALMELKAKILAMGTISMYERQTLGIEGEGLDKRKD